MSKNIVSSPHILGGTSVISGTRIPVSRVIFLLKDGYTVEAIHEEYPQVTIEKLHGVLEEVAQGYGSQAL